MNKFELAVDFETNNFENVLEMNIFVNRFESIILSKRDGKFDLKLFEWFDENEIEDFDGECDIDSENEGWVKEGKFDILNVVKVEESVVKSDGESLYLNCEKFGYGFIKIDKDFNVESVDNLENIDFVNCDINFNF